jgi:hypothetical protein
VGRAVFSEHDDEPLRGLPAALPAGERILWQGSPDKVALALDAYRVRALSVYFLVIIAARFAYLTASGVGFTEALAACIGPAAFSLLCLALLGGVAALAARGTVYTITTRRVVIRQGIALSSSLNLPFAALKSADLRLRSLGTGDITLTPMPGERVSYLWLWPHVRAWRFAQPQPALRNLADPEAAAALLGEAFASVAGARPLQDAGSAQTTPAPAPREETAQRPPTGVPGHHGLAGGIAIAEASR